jgi:EAL and modified HD-GYP domain-containing signal transduction protein
MKEMTGGKKAFINFTRDLLLEEYATILPKDVVVVEILENVEPDEEIVAACQKLKQAGYTVAMDDFVSYEEKFEPLINLTDIIKIDFIEADAEDRKALVEMFQPRGIKLLAEKVETKEEFDQAAEMGYTYFQGYFFSKPVIISGKDIPGFKLTYLQMLQEINSPEMDFRKIEDLIKREVSVSYKLLRYINSAFFGLRRKVESIRQALALLGERNIKKWISLIALSSMGEDKPMELAASSLIRAQFCESLAPKMGMRDREHDLFLMGLFSMIDAIIDRPMAEILDELSISEDIKVALSG